jgi:NAD(P)-dependent dehydrogenase (short-subunit alcohol dehydrogenase family)
MNKNILITGATGNLGKAVLKKFVSDQDKIAALLPPFGDDLKIRDGRIYPFKVDLMNEEEAENSVKKSFSALGSFDMAILIVGGFMMGNLENTSVKDIENMINLNFITAFNTARAAYKLMKIQNKTGGIVFIGARPGLYIEEAAPMMAYGLSKSLVFSLSKIINESGKSDKIWSSVVVPGIIDTPQNRDAMPDADFSNWVKPEFLAGKIAALGIPDHPDYRKEILEVYSHS